MSTRPPWAPPGGLDAELMPAGRWWDAVRVPGYLGDRVLGLLGEESGAVIRDPYGPCLYWLIRPGAAGSWRFPAVAGVRLLGIASYVVVPPHHRTEGGGVRWAVPCVAGGHLTDPLRLHSALTRAITAALGPRRGTVA